MPGSGVVVHILRIEELCILDGTVAGVPLRLWSFWHLVAGERPDDRCVLRVGDRDRAVVREAGSVGAESFVECYQELAGVLQDWVFEVTGGANPARRALGVGDDLLEQLGL